MTARERQADSVGPTRSKRARIAGLLERYLRTSVTIGTHGMFVSAVAFLLYAVVGGILVAVNSQWAPTDFLSMSADPGFFLTGTLVSLFVVQATGSLVLYHFLTGLENDRSLIVILMSYVGLGFGASALRFLLPPTLTFLL